MVRKTALASGLGSSTAELAASVVSRTIPEEFAKNEDAKDLCAAFDELRQSLDDPEMLGQQLRNLMLMMKQHPELYAVVTDDDFDVAAQAASVVLQKARMVKTERKTKRTARVEAVDEMTQMLQDAGISDASGAEDISNFFGSMKI